MHYPAQSGSLEKVAFAPEDNRQAHRLWKKWNPGHRKHIFISSFQFDRHVFLMH